MKNNIGALGRHPGKDWAASKDRAIEELLLTLLLYIAVKRKMAFALDFNKLRLPHQGKQGNYPHALG